MERLLRRRVRVIADGRVTVPLAFRKDLGIQEGSILECYVVKGRLVFEVLAV